MDRSRHVSAQNKLEKRWTGNRQLTELFFQQSLTGCFFSMLDEPLMLEGSTDKDKASDYAANHDRITRANQVILDQYRMAEESILHKAPAEAFAHGLEQEKEMWKDLFSKGQSHVIAEEQRVDGTPIWIEKDYICLYDEQGRIVGYFCIQQDITGRVEAEQKLIERDQLLTKLSQQVPGAIYQYLMRPDGTSCFPFTTDGIWDIFEVTPAEVRDDATVAYSRIHPEDYDRVVSSINSSFQSLSIWDTEYRVVLPKRGSCWVRGVARPEKLADGGVLWHGYLRNVDELKKAEALLIREKYQAETANRAKSQFLANMSHEIRTPMHGILGMLQLLEITQSEQEKQEYIDLAKKCSNTLLTVMNDILDYSMIEAGRVRVERRSFRITDVISEVVALFDTAAKQKGLEIFTFIDHSLPEQATGDPVRMRQVLSNLIGNAIKFTKQGSVSISAEVQPSLGGNKELLITVEDTGIGIPQQKLEEIFISFNQGDNSYTKEYGGAGLGLAISRKLIELMGGRLWATSMVDVGSTFSVSIPYSEKAAPTVNQYASPSTKRLSKQIKLLIVEDHRVSQRLMTQIAQNNGMQYDVADNGKLAVDKVLENQYDVVLMDIQMPIMDGFSATRLIREIDKRNNKRTPIIGVTAYAMEGDRQKCLDAGMDDYLSKPVEIEKLLAAIARVAGD